MLDPEVVEAALLAAAGEIQAAMNQLALAVRGAPGTRLVFESDLRAALRRALQIGRQELVSTESSLGGEGVLSGPVDIVVAARAKAPQLAVELQLHPRGEDHLGFATAAVGDLVKMAVLKTIGAVERAAVLVGAPARFWRWLPGYAEDGNGYQLLTADAETPSAVKSDFLAAAPWNFLFDGGVGPELPDRLWASLLGSAHARSPWAEIELRLFEVKGLGRARPVRG